MVVCTFFGHRECPDSIQANLKKLLINLIEKQHVELFYVGPQGSFDRIVRNTLRELAFRYPHVRYYVVLAYIPQSPKEYDDLDYSLTLLPDGIEAIPKRFAISGRNKWMIQQADYVVTYVTHSWGGAAQFTEIAKKQRKTVFNLPDHFLDNMILVKIHYSYSCRSNALIIAIIIRKAIISFHEKIERSL